MLEGVWSVEFIAREGAGAGGIEAGTITFKDGKAIGGDDTYHYAGEYELSGDRLTGTVAVLHFAGPVRTVFGELKEFEMELSGTIAPDSFLLEGCLVGSTVDDLAIRLTKQG